MEKRLPHRQTSLFPARMMFFLRVLSALLLLFIIGLLPVAYWSSFEKLNLYFLIIFLLLATVGFSALLSFSLGVFHHTDSRLEEDISLLDQLDDALVLTDSSGMVIRANASYKQLFKNHDPNIFNTLSMSSDFDAVMYRLKAKALAGECSREEVRLNKPMFSQALSNTQFWYSLSVKPLRDSHRLMLMWRLADMGSTQQKNEPLFQNLQEAINHLDQAPVGFLSLDGNGKIIYVNATLADWFSIDLAAFDVGKIEFGQLFATENQFSTWKEIEQLCQSASRVVGFPVQPRDHVGTSTQYRAYLSYNGGRDEEDIIYRMVIVPLSSTETKQLPSNADNGRFERFFDQCPFAVATVGKNGELLRMNPPFSQLFGISRDTQAPVDLITLIEQRDGSRIERILKQAVSGIHAAPMLETVMAAEASRHLRLYFIPSNRGPQQSGDEVAILSIIETTEQKTLEDKMVQGQKMQAVGQLAGGIAHDFNNVLTAILMSCDLLLASHRSSDPAHSDLINIKNNANRAASLVQQLLAFSRRQTLRPEVIDLTELLSDVRNLLMPLLGSNVQLKVIHGRDLWDVEVDQSSFQRVLMNLVINARDAMPEGGCVTISTSNIDRDESLKFGYDGLAAGEYVELDVQDTGTGIANAVKEKMFEPFFTTKEVGKGTGLGLSMVYGIIKQSGGYIYCDSEEGKGTVFRIFLPRHIRSLVDSAVSQPQLSGQESALADKNTDLSGSATVLLVEDEDAVRMGGVRALQSRGYTVLEAGNGVEALEILEEEAGAVDIVVSDVVMPEMDGPTLLGELRKKYPEIKFVFVSGYAKDAFAKNLPEDAVFGFLSKPFTLKQLALKVKQTLEGAPDV